MSDLETLLRATTLRRGRISLDVIEGVWSATVCHFNGPMTHPMGEFHGDPVTALRVTLVEDARRTADVQRRYDAAPRATRADPRQIDLEEAIAAAAVPATLDFEDLLG